MKEDTITSEVIEELRKEAGFRRKLGHYKQADRLDFLADRMEDRRAVHEH